MLLLQASLTTRPSKACPTPSLPIVKRKGMPTNSAAPAPSPLTALYCSVHCGKGKCPHPQPNTLPEFLAISLQQSRQTWAHRHRVGWQRRSKQQPPLTLKLPCSFNYSGTFSGEVRVPDPPGTCKERAQGRGGRREPRRLAC